MKTSLFLLKLDLLRKVENVFMQADLWLVVLATASEIMNFTLTFELLEAHGSFVSTINVSKGFLDMLPATTYLEKKKEPINTSVKGDCGSNVEENYYTCKQGCK